MIAIQPVAPPAPKKDATVEVCHESGFPFIDDAAIAARLSDGWVPVASYATLAGHCFIHFSRKKNARSK